jgi:hypothetical protein
MEASESASDASKVWTASALPQSTAWWRSVRSRFSGGRHVPATEEHAQEHHNADLGDSYQIQSLDRNRHGSRARTPRVFGRKASASIIHSSVESCEWLFCQTDPVRNYIICEIVVLLKSELDTFFCWLYRSTWCRFQDN